MRIVVQAETFLRAPSIMLTSASPIKVLFNNLPVTVENNDEKDMTSYPEILETIFKRKRAEAEAGQISDYNQPYQNAKATLRSFLMMLSMDEGRVGSELLTKFEENILEFEKYLIEKKKVSRNTASNNISTLRYIKATYDTIRAEKAGQRYGTLPAELLRLQTAADVTLKEISEATDVSHSVLKSMFRGRPLKSNVGGANLARLESFFISKGVMEESCRHSLSKIAIFEGKKYGTKSDEENPVNSEVLKTISIQKSTIADSDVLEQPRLAVINAEIRKHIDRIYLSKRSSGAWCRKQTFSTSKRDFSTTEGDKRFRTPSAELFYSPIAAYISFISKRCDLSKSISEVTIEDLFRVDHYQRHMIFLSERRQGRSGQARKKLKDSMRLLLADVEAEIQNCETSEFKNRLAVALSKFKVALESKTVVEEKSRDYNDMVSYFLNLNKDEPMRFFFEIIKKEYDLFKSTCPETTSAHSILRNAVCLAILCVCPIREKNMAELTYKPDNLGEFFFDEERNTYSIRIPAHKTKNKKEILATFPTQLNPLFDDYINITRQNYLEKSRMLSDFLIVYERIYKNNQKPIQNSSVDVYDVIKKITGKYVTNGLNPHFFRHMGASAILHKNPGAWGLAATLLDDKIETVMKSYAHRSSGHMKDQISEDAGSLLKVVKF